MDGTQEPQAEPELPRRFSKSSHQFDPVPRRDERFQDLWNQGVNAEAFLYSDQYPPEPKR